MPSLRTTLTALACLATAASGLVAIGTTSASATTGNNIAALAIANFHTNSSGVPTTGYCSTNSTGAGSNVSGNPGKGFVNSCNPGEYWCADFVRWAWTQSGIPAASWMSASVPTWRNSPNYHPTNFDPQYQSGAIGYTGGSAPAYTPQPGDAIVWGDPYASKSTAGDDFYGSHISIVTGVSSNGYLTDISGDASGVSGNWLPTSHVVENEYAQGAVHGTSGGYMNPAASPNSSGIGGPIYGWRARIIGYVSPGASSGSTPGVTSGFSLALNGVSAGQTVSGTVNLSATANIVNQVNYVRYLVTGPNGYNQTFIPNAGGSPTANTPAYAFPWNTASLPNGTYNISLYANEIDGQNHYWPGGGTTAPGAPISVSVNNSALTGTAAIAPTSQIDGYGTVHTFAVAAPGGELTETMHAPDGGTTWRNLSVNGGAPASQGGLASVTEANGTIDLFAYAKPAGELTETRLAPDGGITWSNLSVNGGAPASSGTPSAVIDASGTIHLFALANPAGELTQTLIAPNGGITWSNLSVNGGAPASSGGLASVIDNTGTIDLFALAKPAGELTETRIASNGGLTWSNLSVNGGAPASSGTPSAVIDASGTIHLFALANPAGELTQTLIAPNGGITWSNLSVNGGAPASSGGLASTITPNGTVHLLAYAKPAGELTDTQIASNGGITWTNLSVNGGAPAAVGTPAVLVDGNGTLHITSVDAKGYSLDETMRASDGGMTWTNLTVNTGGPSIGS